MRGPKRRLLEDTSPCLFYTYLQRENGSGLEWSCVKELTMQTGAPYIWLHVVFPTKNLYKRWAVVVMCEVYQLILALPFPGTW